jgi:cytochrome c oxidase subunit 2
LADGGTVTVDENYIRESILEPMAKVVAGYEPVMPTYQGRLKDAEIMAIIEYLKSLSGNG